MLEELIILQMLRDLKMTEEQFFEFCQIQDLHCTVFAGNYQGF